MARSLALGLYLMLADRGAPDVRPPRPRRPDGPLLWVNAATGTRPEAMDQLMRGLAASRPGLAVLVTSEATPPPEGVDCLTDLPPPDRGPSVRDFLDHWRPDAALFLGSDLPPALVTEAHERRLPMILADAQLDPGATSFWRRGMVASVLARFDRILARDAASAMALQRLGGRALPVERAGHIEAVPDPLPCNEAEREVMADLLRARPVWLAAACPEAEEEAVIAAHIHAMSHAHRLLLILAPTDPARVEPLIQRLTDEGLIVAARARDEEPDPEVQVYLTDGPTEMGLWYRLAPVTWLGGSLTGPAIRNPAEPAALGSAIVHGPAGEPHGAALARLAEARATHAVQRAADLPGAIAELIAPDKAALLAANAWVATSAGAEAVDRIVGATLSALDRVA